MTSNDEMSTDEIVARGYAAVMQALGTDGYIRFVQATTPGQGDYTEWRRGWLETVSREEIIAGLEAMIAARERQATPTPTRD